MKLKRFSYGLAFVAQHVLASLVLRWVLVDTVDMVWIWFLLGFAGLDWWMLWLGKKKALLSKGAITLAFPADAVLCWPLLVFLFCPYMLLLFHSEGLTEMFFMILLPGFLFVGLRFWLLWRHLRVDRKKLFE